MHLVIIFLKIEIHLRVIQLIPMMPDRVTPRGKKTTLLRIMNTTVLQNNGRFVVIKKKIWCIRQGIDPNNHRGFAPLKSVLREFLVMKQLVNTLRLFYNWLCWRHIVQRRFNGGDQDEQKLSPRCTSPSSAVLTWSPMVLQANGCKDQTVSSQTKWLKN